MGIHLSSRCGLLLSAAGLGGGREKRECLKSKGKLVLNSFLLSGITRAAESIPVRIHCFVFPRKRTKPEPLEVERV